MSESNEDEEKKPAGPIYLTPEGHAALMGSAGEPVPDDPREAAHESNVNKSQDTTHVHSSTTSRKV